MIDTPIGLTLGFGPTRKLPGIYIYNGPGVSLNALGHTKRFFQKIGLQICEISPLQVIEGGWEEKAALFVLPGGADIPYRKELNGVGNQRIRSFVEKGGAFLGICAGSYYAGAFVDFDAPPFVQEKRELSFFPGVVKGPVFEGYDPNSLQGARAVILKWGDETCPFFYHGGGHFVDADRMENVSVIASYDTQKQESAIIQCSVGKGQAILSAVHFEYDPILFSILEERNEDRLRLSVQLMRQYFLME